MIVTLQIQIDPQMTRPVRMYSDEELQEIEGKMNELCSSLEQYGYVRCGMYVDQQAYTRR